MAGMEPTGKEPSPEVQAFADALQDWAERGTGPDRGKRETLLKWLLSRCKSRGFELKGESGANKYIIERRPITDIDIKEAVMRAMAGYNPDLPTAGWVRGGPIWPKGYGDFWPKGYA